ncbi:MAG: hypothetical protein Q8O52_13280 [Sulfuritalea sp.]|nr:hypothetical protein [Sulfuritalea sp.]
MGAKILAVEGRRDGGFQFLDQPLHVAPQLGTTPRGQGQDAQRLRINGLEVGHGWRTRWLCLDAGRLRTGASALVEIPLLSIFRASGIMPPIAALE